MIKLSLKNIRTRLTLWNILVFGGILTLYAFGTTWFFLSTLGTQLDESLKEELELVEQMLFHLPEGEYFIDTHEDDAKRLERFIELWSTDGMLLYRSGTLGKGDLGPPPDSSEYTGSIRSVLSQDGTRLRVASLLHSTPTNATLVRLGVSEEAYFAIVHNFTNLLLIAIPFALLLLTVSAYVLARNALRPIDAMASTARRITAEQLHERLPVVNPEDELGRLASTFNELLGRVEKSFQQLRRFTSDASHQLRTPLTAMRSVGEVGLQGTRTGEEYREVIGSMLEESNRLTHLVDSLLFLSRGEAGKLHIVPSDLDVFELVNDTAGMLRILAEERHQQFLLKGNKGITVTADRTLLTQALLNLMDNAIKFTPEGGLVRVDVSSDTKICKIAVSDSGPGIPAHEQEKVFERFYRVSKDGGPGGSGLGLAIARWAIEANGGSISVESGNGSGSTFLISLPCTPKP